MYPVKWRNQTYTLHDLNVKGKESFCRWAKRWLSMDLIQTLGDIPAALNPALVSISALVWWGDEKMSKQCSEMLEHPDGDLFLNRLLFGDSVKTLSDSDLQALIDEKVKEQEKADEKAKAAGLEKPYPPTNDYFLAMRAIQEASGPKAEPPGIGAAPAVVTPTTATS